MTHHQLTRLLAAIVALPGLASAAVACTPCPYSEVVSTRDVSLDPAVACDVAAGAFLGAPSNVCAKACGDAAINSCFLDSAYTQAFADANPLDNSGAGGAGGGGSMASCPSMKATITCEVRESRGEYHKGCPIDGRRPAGLAEPVIDGSAIGVYLATSAHLEAASIVAFRILHEELDRLGAPRDLLREVLRAETDEVRHTAVMTRLAATYGALAPEPEVAAPALRSAAAIAIENMIEGVVRETFGAAVALFQVRHAADPAIREAMRAIAGDECAHAALAFRTARFLDGHLDAASRVRVEAGKQEAMEELFASLVEPDPTLRRLAGLPSVAEATQILEAMVAELWSTARAA